MSLTTRGRRLAGVAIVAGVAAALSLTGCSGSNAPGDGTGTLTLQFWNGLTGSDKTSVDEVVSGFNKSQDKIKVVSTAMPWDVLKQKLLSSIASGSGPGVVSIDTADMAQYVDAGALQPVDDFYASGQLDTDKLVKAAVDANKLDGKTYGIPLNFFTEMMYWNKDMFAAAGYDHPPATWAEFAEMAPKLTIDKDGDGTPEQYPISLGDHDTVPMFQPLLWNTGGGIVSDDGKKALLDDPKTLEALNFWVDQVRKNKITPVGMNGPDADKLFQTGKAAIELCGPWVAPAIKQAGINFGVAQTFAGPKDQISLAGSVSFTVPKGVSDEQKKAAYAFATYWNGKKVQAKYSEETGFPSTRTDITSADTGSNPYPAIFGDPKVTSASKVFLAGVKNGSTINTTVFVPALQKALNGEGTVDQLFKQANKDAQALLDK